jgi:hypothetical protein
VFEQLAGDQAENTKRIIFQISEQRGYLILMRPNGAVIEGMPLYSVLIYDQTEQLIAGTEHHIPEASCLLMAGYLIGEFEHNILHQPQLRTTGNVFVTAN